MGKIFQEIVRNARLHEIKPAIVDDAGTSITFRQLHEHVLSLSDFFESKGFGHKGSRKTTRVALAISDELLNIYSVLALNKLGCEIVVLNHKLMNLQFNDAINAAEAEVLIHDGCDEVLALQIDAPKINVNHAIEFKSIGNEICDRNESQNYKNNTPFLITMSSGSTGKPKPIIFSEKNKIDRAYQSARLYNVLSADVILCASPFHHSLGQRLTFLSILLGSTLVILRKFTSKNWLRVVSQHNVTFTIAVSSHLHSIKSYLLKNDFPNSLRCLVSSSAGIDLETKKTLFRNPNIDFYEIYGASEVAVVTNLDKEGALQKLESVGKPCDGVSVEICDPNGLSCAADQVGEICVSSRLISPGYINRPMSVHKIDGKKFFRTGDQGFLDPDGFLHFMGRSDDMIITGGMNFFPSDVVNVISKHEQVIEVEIIGLPDPILGQIVAAVVAVTRGEDVESDLRRLCRSKLAPFQRPVKYRFVSNIPKLDSGKTDRLALSDFFS